MPNEKLFSDAQANTATFCSVPTLRFSPHSVLLVTDCPEDFQSLQDSLREQLFHVTTISDGWNAYYHAQTLSSSLLLIDMEMGSFDSLTLCRLVRRADLMPRVGVILASRKNSPCLRIAALELGVLDVLSLPLDPDELMWRAVMYRRTVLQRCEATVECRLRGAAESVIGSPVVKTVINLVKARGHALGSVSDLAKAVGVNRRRLVMLFKDETGESLASYLRRHRIVTACRLLTTTTMPINEVAKYIGFKSSCNFTVAFQKTVGVTPSHYRQKNNTVF